MTGTLYTPSVQAGVVAAGNRRMYADSDSMIYYGNTSDSCATEYNRSGITFGKTSSYNWERPGQGAIQLISRIIGTRHDFLFNFNTAASNVAPSWIPMCCLPGDATFVAIGAHALTTLISSTSVTNTNVGIGYQALRDASATCIDNVAIGWAALRGLTTGNQNTSIGTSAGRDAGTSATSITASTASTFIGYNTKANGNNQSNQIVIGANAIGGGNDTCTIGSSAMTYRMWASSWTNLSDLRIKEEISEVNLDRCVEIVKTLPVRRYKYKDFYGKRLDRHVTGFIADDVEKIFPKSITKVTQSFPLLDENGEKQYETVDGREVIKQFEIEDVKELTMSEGLPTLWGAVQSLIKQNEEKDALIQNLIKRIEVLESTKRSKRKSKTILEENT